MAKKGYTILDFLRTYSKNMIDFSSKKTKGFSTLKINFIYILILGPMKQCKMEWLLASNIDD